MKRREFLKSATILGAATASASCLSTPDSGVLRAVPELLKLLVGSFDDTLKRDVVVDYDHPLRQYHNRGVSLGGARLGLGSFSWEQLKLVNELFYAGLSEAGRSILPRQFFLKWRGIRTLRLLIAGDPSSPHCQAILSGPHLNMRIGGKSREGIPFGGPMVYGDQRGNNSQGLPGNIYRYQFETAHRLLKSLTPEQRSAAILATAPVQTQIGLQGDSGDFEGVSIAGLSDASKEIAKALVDDILDVYRTVDANDARDCLASNGGIDALRLAYYREGEVGGSGQYQMFRLEGPAAVFYFRGYPHVHAFINVGNDPAKPLSVGETIAQTSTVLAGASVQSLFERAMLDFCDTDLAYYDLESVAGRLRAGTIRTGDIYSLESWNNEVHIVTIKGSSFSDAAKRLWVSRGIVIDETKTYTVATTDHVVSELLGDHLGNGKPAPAVARLREVTIDYLKARAATDAPP